MKTHTAPRKVVGLAYEPGHGLPQVVVKGCGELAESILRERDMRGGPQVIEDAELVDQLYRLPVDGSIGPELFQLVSILLAHVFAIEEKLRGELR